MFNEKSSPREERDEIQEERDAHVNNLHLRREIKNLVDYVEAGAKGLPQREEVLAALKNILTLVPPHDEDEEAYEEDIRRLENEVPGGLDSSQR